MPMLCYGHWMNLLVNLRIHTDRGSLQSVVKHFLTHIFLIYRSIKTTVLRIYVLIKFCTDKHIFCDKSITYNHKLEATKKKSISMPDRR